MPTSDGRETISERITRLEAELTAVRAAITAATTNGQSFNIGGTAVTRIALEHLEAREARLAAAISRLRDRIAGTAGPTAIAQTQTSLD